MVFSNERNLTFVDNPVVAQPLLDFLRDNGIEASLREEDDLGGLNPALAFVHGSYILVTAEQLAQAEALVAEYRAAPVESSPELEPDPEAEPDDGEGSGRA